MAHVAVTAGDVERDDDPVARLEGVNLGPHLFDHAHRLVAQDVARIEIGPEQFVEVKVRAADPAGGDPYDDVVGLLDPRIRHSLHADVPLPLPSQCTHDAPCRAI